MAPPAPPDDVAGACSRLLPALPADVDGQERRATDPESPLTAAWGDPAIVLRCGVPRPGAYDPAGQVAEVEGVAWLPQQTDEGYVFTTIGRVADVEVRVPRAYAPEVNPLVDLAAPVRDRLPQRPL